MTEAILRSIEKNTRLACIYFNAILLQNYPNMAVKCEFQRDK